MLISGEVGRAEVPRSNAGKHRFAWKVRRRIAACAVFLAAAATGCDGAALPVTWEASGTEVTRLEMPLDEHGNTFIVGEYTLEGREGSGDPARPFRDRVLLSIHAQGIEGYVLGYITRTYEGGQVRTFRLYGTERRAVQDSKTMVVIGRAHGLGPAAAGRYPFLARVELRIDSTGGHVLAKGSSHGRDAAVQGRADTRTD